MQNTPEGKVLQFTVPETPNYDVIFRENDSPCLSFSVEIKALRRKNNGRNQ